MKSPLLSLSDGEWENLCDGCGRCCVVKLEDEDSGELHYTNVACEFLDIKACRCSDYENRAVINPQCMVLGRANLETMNLMPLTCAYRIVHEGRQAEQDIVALSVSGKVVSEKYIHQDQFPDHVIEWINS